jgi:outer membrane murein-binding lipoprotein Lpp
MSLRRSFAIVTTFGLIIAGCSDPTQSDEYQSLEAELDQTQTDLSDTNIQLDETLQELDETKTELDAAHKELTQAQEDLASAEDEVSRLTGELEDERSRIEPYPPEVIDLFVEGCTEGDPGLAEECECTIVSLQDTMPLSDFFVVSAAFEALELDPVTGQPLDSSFLDIPGADVFFEAFFDCLLA